MIGLPKEKLQELRNRFPKGARVRLISMDDPQAPPPGTEGEVIMTGGIGTIHVAWDTGSTLGAVYGVDEIVPLN